MYIDKIRTALSRCKTLATRNASPAIVECWMRLTYGVLDGLSKADFAASAREGAEMVANHPSESAMLASTYEMSPEKIAKEMGLSIEQVQGFLKVNLPANDEPFELFAK